MRSNGQSWLALTWELRHMRSNVASVLSLFQSSYHPQPWPLPSEPTVDLAVVRARFSIVFNN